MLATVQLSLLASSWLACCQFRFSCRHFSRAWGSLHVQSLSRPLRAMGTFVGRHVLHDLEKERRRALRSRQESANARA